MSKNIISDSSSGEDTPLILWWRCFYWILLTEEEGKQKKIPKKVGDVIKLLQYVRQFYEALEGGEEQSEWESD